MKLIFCCLVSALTSILISLPALAQQAPNPDCALTPDVLNNNLGLDYETFTDVFQKQKNIGWRSFLQKGCPFEAATLIDIYHLQRFKNLYDWQHMNLYFSTAQLYGLASMNKLAVARLTSAQIGGGIDDSVNHWNDYLNGIIAFLQNNLYETQENRDILATLNSPGAKISRGVLDLMILCRGGNYKEVYGDESPCKAKYIQKNAIDIQVMSVPEALLKKVADKKLLLIGENHGVKEYPDYTGAIVEAISKKQPVAVGLEFPTDLQKTIDAYMVSGDERLLKAQNFFADPTEHSGRGSPAMFGLLKKIRDLKIPVFCFDVSNINGDTSRDARMAQNILDYMAAHKDKLVITYSGNIHSRLTPWSTKLTDSPTMGAEILRLSNKALNLSNTTNLRFSSDTGSAWQCQSDAQNRINCGIYKFGPSNSIYASAVPTLNRYLLMEEGLYQGHDMTLFIRNVQASESK